MTNLAKVVQGLAITIASLTILTILTWIIPPLITAVEQIFSSSDLRQIIWFGVIILYIIVGIVFPTAKIIEGIQEPDENKKFQNITLAIVLFIFGMLLTYKGWFMITAFMSMATTDTANPLLSAVFYTSIILNWFLIVIFTPTYMTINSLKEGE